MTGPCLIGRVILYLYQHVSQSTFLHHTSISCLFLQSVSSLEIGVVMQTCLRRELTRDLDSGIFVDNSAVNELHQPLVSAKVSQLKVVVETNL